MKIVLLGSPGVGKGTYSERIVEYFSIPHISTGVIFRANVESGTYLGKKAKEYMNKGLLVPDDITVPMVADRLNEEDTQDGFILDGFPRNVYQAKELSKNAIIDLVVNYVATQEIILERISGRRVSPKCGETYNIKFKPPKTERICDVCGDELIQRKDDKSNVVKERLAEYKLNSTPLVKYYKKQNLLTVINANSGKEDIIFNETIKALDKIKTSVL